MQRFVTSTLIILLRKRYPGDLYSAPTSQSIHTNQDVQIHRFNVHVVFFDTDQRIAADVISEDRFGLEPNILEYKTVVFPMDNCLPL